MSTPGTKLRTRRTGASRALLVGAASAWGALAGCGEGEPELWIYTSLYPEVIAEMEPALQAAVPGVRVRWFQGGSEIVASRLNAELLAGSPRADLILTSDPFWYRELDEAGHLLPHRSEAARAVPPELRDPADAFVTVRIPVMVLAFDGERLPPDAPPSSWRDLTDAGWAGRVSMGSPLESGTTFTAVALLSRRYGWEYFEALRAGEILSAGGNSSVITRIETGERPVGMVLLENVLAARSRGSPVQAVYPADGAVPVPSPIALMRATEHPELARRVYDWFFSPEAQRAIVRGGMYSPLPDLPSPEGALPWEQLQARLLPWSPDVLDEVYGQREAIKARFSEVVLR